MNSMGRLPSRRHSKPIAVESRFCAFDDGPGRPCLGALATRRPTALVHTVPAALAQMPDLSHRPAFKKKEVK